MGLTTALTATGIAAGLALTGVAVASAASGTSTPGTTAATSSNGSAITLPAGGVLEKRVTTFCAKAPKIAARAEKAQKRLSGDADTKGSLARVEARQAKAAKNDHPRVAERLERVVERRTTRLAELPDRRATLAKAQTECATLK